MTAPTSGLDSLRRVNQTQMAWILGLQPYQFRDRTTNYMPRNEDGTYDVQACVAAYLAEQLSAVAVEEDPKSRKLTADANMSELRYLQMSGDLIPVVRLDPYLTEISVILKRGGEQLQKTCGVAGYDIYSEMLEEIERAGDRVIDEAVEEEAKPVETNGGSEDA